MARLQLWTFLALHIAYSYSACVFRCFCLAFLNYYCMHRRVHTWCVHLLWECHQFIFVLSHVCFDGCVILFCSIVDASSSLVLLAQAMFSTQSQQHSRWLLSPATHMRLRRSWLSAPSMRDYILALTAQQGASS